MNISSLLLDQKNISLLQSYVAKESIFVFLLCALVFVKFFKLIYEKYFTKY